MLLCVTDSRFLSWLEGSNLSDRFYGGLLVIVKLDLLGQLGAVRVGRLLVNQAHQVCQLVNDLEQLDQGDVGVVPLQVLLVYLANSLHALVNRLVVRVGAGLWLGAGVKARLTDAEA